MAAEYGLALRVSSSALIGLNYLQWNMSPWRKNNSCPAGFRNKKGGGSGKRKRNREAAIRQALFSGRTRVRLDALWAWNPCRAVARRGSPWAGRGFGEEQSPSQGLRLWNRSRIGSWGSAGTLWPPRHRDSRAGNHAGDGAGRGTELRREGAGAMLQEGDSAPKFRVTPCLVQGTLIK